MVTRTVFNALFQVMGKSTRHSVVAPKNMEKQRYNSNTNYWTWMRNSGDISSPYLQHLDPGNKCIIRNIYDCKRGWRFRSWAYNGEFSGIVGAPGTGCGLDRPVTTRDSVTKNEGTKVRLNRIVRNRSGGGVLISKRRSYQLDNIIQQGVIDYILFWWHN